jgi:phosphoglycolate phosphatase-like HAD superfamily hydrolase
LTKTLLLFDIDGTLLRADDSTRRAINITFGEIFGIKDPQQNVPFAGRTDLGIFKDVALELLGRPLSTGELKQVADRYVELLPGQLKRSKFDLMPGVEALLSNLSAREDILLGLETGNIEPAAYLKLKRGGIDRFFSFGGFGSDSENRTELVRLGIERARSLNHDKIPDESIFVIGDSVHDITAGNNLGVNTIAVGTGHVKREQFLAASATHFMQDLDDLTVFLRYIGCEK